MEGAAAEQAEQEELMVLPELGAVVNNNNNNYQGNNNNSNNNETEDFEESSNANSPSSRVSPLVSVSTAASRPNPLFIPKFGPGQQQGQLGQLGQGLDWQTGKQNLCERGQYLLETGVWSDCTFIVGLPPNVKVCGICTYTNLN